MMTISSSRKKWVFIVSLDFIIPTSVLSCVLFTGAETCGHFTQMVWKGSRELGVGRAVSDNGRRTYVVCNYFPAGNLVGHFEDNVPSRRNLK
jgi:hypothetical protein